MDRLSQEEYIERCTTRHGTAYGLSHIVYVRGTDKIKVECFKHGFFYPQAEAFMRGTGCKSCGQQRNGKSKQISFDKFEADSKSHHGTKFNYSHVRDIWSGNKTRFELFCPVHQESFITTAESHSRGADCPKCSKERGGVKQRGNTEKFVADGKARFGERFDYSETVYIKSNLKVDIRCTKHDKWLKVTPNMHLAGYGGCPDCANQATSERCKKSTEQFISEATEEHGTLYKYDRVIYDGVDKKVEIGCVEHGYFWQWPGSHLNGSGCPNCGNNGYKTHKSGYLYVFTDGALVKVGITNKSPEIRCKFVSKDSERDFRVVKFYQFANGRTPLDIETTLLQELQRSYRPCTDKFSGSTECFYDVNLASLLNRIESLIKEQYSSIQASQEA